MRPLLAARPRCRFRHALSLRLPALRAGARCHRLPSVPSDRLTQVSTDSMQLTMSETEQTETVTASAPTEQKDRRLYLFLISALVIVADRITKIAIVHRIRPGYTIPIIPHIFYLSHVLNTGAAFSLMENWPPDRVRIGLIVFSVAAALVLLALLWRGGKQLTMTSVALALIFGGALGNLYDRIRYHHVVDFL